MLNDIEKNLCGITVKCANYKIQMSIKFTNGYWVSAKGPVVFEPLAVLFVITGKFKTKYFKYKKEWLFS